MAVTTEAQRQALDALLAKADAALAANGTRSAAIQGWLDSGPFTQAGTLAAVKQIAENQQLQFRELNALVRLVRGMYGAHDGLVDADDT